MQWSQIKTLFIFSFLILNIYLLFQFFEKQEDADIDLLERQESTIEEQLETENIKLPKLPKEQAKEPFISVGQKMFSEDDMDLFDEFENQKPVLIEKKLIISLFEKPVPLPKDASSEKIEELVKEMVVFPEEYVYWDWNKDRNVLIFFQKENERPVYFNQNGMLIVYLNDDNEMHFYSQTMLGEVESRQDKKSLIEPIKAIETLYKANELLSGDEIIKVDIGFHTMVPLANGVQVFVPTWKVKINGEEHFFVNAIEGFIFSSNELEFLEETVLLSIERVETSLKDDQKMKDQILKLLTDELTGKSEVE